MIRVSKMNFTDGHLIHPEWTHTWIGHEKTRSNTDLRSEIILDRPNVPTGLIGMSKMQSNTYQFVNFVNTDMDKDAAQTTVPYLDAQAASSEPAVPLAGLGIYFKGGGDSGGFIAPKIFTYDYSEHF